MALKPRPNPSGNPGVEESIRRRRQADRRFWLETVGFFVVLAILIWLLR